MPAELGPRTEPACLLKGPWMPHTACLLPPRFSRSVDGPVGLSMYWLLHIRHAHTYQHTTMHTHTHHPTHTHPHAPTNTIWSTPHECVMCHASSGARRTRMPCVMCHAFSDALCAKMSSLGVVVAPCGTTCHLVFSNVHPAYGSSFVIIISRHH